MFISFMFLIFFSRNKRIHIVKGICNFYINFWRIFVGLRYKYYGKENIDFNKSYVIIANHVNILDIPISAQGIHLTCKPLYKKELEKIPFLGWLFKLSSVPVDRSSKESRKASMKRLTEELRMGVSIFMFPEGTRNRTKEPLKDFFMGAFNLSVDTGRPILPIIYSGTRMLNKIDTFLLNPGLINIHYLAPIYPEGRDALELREYCRSIMRNKIIEVDEYFKDYDKN